MDADAQGAIEQRLADLEAEVARLSARFQEPDCDEPPYDPPAEAAASEDPLWFVNELGRRAPGAVMMAGAVETPEGPIRWQYGLYAEKILSEDWSEHARSLEALGHRGDFGCGRRPLQAAHRDGAQLAAANMRQ